MVTTIMDKKTSRAIFKRFAEHNPNPTTELKYKTPFELLIAVILSARATDISVNKATEKLYPKANTPATLLKMGEEKLKSYIKTIGLYQTKAKHIIQTCEILQTKYDAKVPTTREALESLPGVGRKTANVILNTLLGELTIAVDTHVFRVSNRTGLAKGTTPAIVEKKIIRDHSRNV